MSTAGETRPRAVAAAPATGDKLNTPASS